MNGNTINKELKIMESAAHRPTPLSVPKVKIILYRGVGGKAPPPSPCAYPVMATDYKKNCDVELRSLWLLRPFC